jgi:hypothetical protein
MLDEIDKLGAGGFHGDPASALLEVLDPEQNSTFRDNYLGVPFDLSGVMFVCTANVLDTIPGPLRDRMEVIQLPGYTAQEKLQIARRYLAAAPARGRGPHAGAVRYRRRGVARHHRRLHARSGRAQPRARDRQRVPLRGGAGGRRHGAGHGDRSGRAGDDPGPLRFEAELAMRGGVPGVATGLAWTPVGGDILFIEAARMPGSGKLILTGQLGDVMKESAQAALSWSRRARRARHRAELLEKSDIHVHVPAGATPKDGPSAGVAMFTALSSLLTSAPVRSDVAMTGEISLRGLVLPIGGVKEKVLAALRAGIQDGDAARAQPRDLEEIPRTRASSSVRVGGGRGPGDGGGVGSSSGGDARRPSKARSSTHPAPPVRGRAYGGPGSEATCSRGPASPMRRPRRRTGFSPLPAPHQRSTTARTESALTIVRPAKDLAAPDALTRGNTCAGVAPIAGGPNRVSIAATRDRETPRSPSK